MCVRWKSCRSLLCLLDADRSRRDDGFGIEEDGRSDCGLE